MKLTIRDVIRSLVSGHGFTLGEAIAFAKGQVEVFRAKGLATPIEKAVDYNEDAYVSKMEEYGAEFLLDMDNTEWE